VIHVCENKDINMSYLVLFVGQVYDFINQSLTNVSLKKGFNQFRLVLYDRQMKYPLKEVTETRITKPIYSYLKVILIKVSV